MTPKKVFMGMLAALSLVIAGGAGLFTVIDGQLQTKSKEISVLKSDVDILDLKIRNSQEAAAELEKYRDIEAILDDVLPPEKIQNDIIAEILDLASKNNATVENITFPSTDGATLDFTRTQTSAVDGVKGVLAVEIGLTVTTNFQGMLNLLDDFEQNQRKMQVSTVNITPVKDDRGNLTGGFNLILKINAFQRA